MRLLPLLLLASFSLSTLAGTDGTVRGTVLGATKAPVAGATVKLLDAGGVVVKEAVVDETGAFLLFPVVIGDYMLQVEAPGFAPYRSGVGVQSGGTVDLGIELAVAGTDVQIHRDDKEMVMRVRAKRSRRVRDSSTTSSTQITKEDIKDLPQGEQIRLPKLIASTTPGVLAGTFGQLYFRGNHSNIQYQIDGVQLPDSPSNTFGDAFTPRNIERMEVITGGIPAEYGQRLSAVVNIVTKTGPEKPGGSVELNYGTYNFFSPTAAYGGSTGDGAFRYFLSANYNRTDRGIDTPQPASLTNVREGGGESVHNNAWGHNEFIKLDWQASNENKWSLVFFNVAQRFQIPVFPSSFQPTDPLFTGGDGFGNDPYLYFPATTDNSQFEHGSYVQLVWRHTFSPRSFLQIAPYWKYSHIAVTGDPANDLAGATLVPVAPGGTGNIYASFSQNRNIHNVGVKSDYTWRASESHLVKAGIQVQAAQSRGSYSIQTAQQGQPNQFFSDATPNDSFYESLYVQDDWTIAKPLVLKAGLRFDATQFRLGGGTNPQDSALQPRLGLSYLVTDTTKVHGFYGKLFQPAPVENLRGAFNALQGTPLTPYDIKAEKADYYEAGVAQELPGEQVISVTAFYKNAENFIDNIQLFNTAIAQPINFATAYVHGVEVSLTGDITDELRHYVNYSYVLGKGKGMSGGFFTNVTPPTDYQTLDHIQLHTVNAGLTYRRKSYWLTVQGLVGSGLRTGPDNATPLPAHFTMDATVGYEFRDIGLKLSLDVLNLWNYRYPIKIQNGYNGSHYASGRQVLVHLVKEI